MVLVGIPIGWHWYWQVFVLLGTAVGIPIGWHWYWQVFVLLGTAVGIVIAIAIHTHILLKSLFSQDHSIMQNTKNAYLPPSLSFLENSHEKSFLGLAMANITPHFTLRKHFLAEILIFNKLQSQVFGVVELASSVGFSKFCKKFLTVETC